MTVVTLAQATNRLAELVDQVAAGHTIYITRHGKVVAQLTAAKPNRLPISLAEMQALTRSQQRQPVSAGCALRKLRDESRY